MQSQNDTIAAISTAPGEGAIGIIRLSGSRSLSILSSIFRTSSDSPLNQYSSHKLYYGHIIDDTGISLDEVLAVYMKAPKTYTREDIVEIHCHGGTSALQQVLQVVLKKGARPAEPGEFTLLAFLNGRLDLTQAEAVMDVIQAKTRKSLICASDQLGGRLGRNIEELKNRLVKLTAHLEAYIDFPEEEIPQFDFYGFRNQASDLIDELETLIGTYSRGRILREGAAVAIIGRPNVGKSSLLNMLLAEERAIVTDMPGTTRDTIEESINVEGLPVRLIDTAGIRQCHNLAESEGVKRSREVMKKADVVLLVLDRSRPLHDSDLELIKMLKGRKALIVLNKKDLSSAFSLTCSGLSKTCSGRFQADFIEISALKSEGIADLKSEIRNLIIEDPSATEGATITRIRHKTSLEKALQGLSAFISGLKQSNTPPEILALDLREALDGLDQILGVTTADDILNVIFKDFCIGK